MSGAYVVIEGVDGTGKSSLAVALTHALSKMGLPVIQVAEPTRQGAGAVLRKAWAEGTNLGWRYELKLFCEDRKTLLPTIQYALRKGFIVISDRSFLSSAVYQGAIANKEYEGETGNLPPEAGEINNIIASHVSWFPYPNVVLLLEVPEEDLVQRLSERANPKELNRAEQQLFAEEYYLLSEELHFNAIDATQDPDKVLSQALQALARKGIGKPHKYDNQGQCVICKEMAPSKREPCLACRDKEEREVRTCAMTLEKMTSIHGDLFYPLGRTVSTVFTREPCVLCADTRLIESPDTACFVPLDTTTEDKCQTPPE